MENDEVKKWLADLTRANEALIGLASAKVASAVEEAREWRAAELKRISESLRPAFDARTALIELAVPLQATAANITRALVDTSGLRESAAKLSEARADAQKKLWQSGWMMSMDMPIPLAIKAAEMLQADPDEIDEALNEFFEERLDQIEQDLVANFPHRGAVIRAILTAHKAGQFEVAIPTAFAQSDGICHELVGVELYKKRNGQPVVGAELNGLSLGDFWASILAVLGDTGPMNASKNERAALQFEEAFNRHRVMHGEASDYGTQVNSARAISLLNFVGTVLKRAISKG